MRPGSPGDDVLRWASECESGPWQSLKDTCAHALQAHSLTHPRPWQLAADLAALGHIDIDWDEGRWSVAPPALVLARGMGLCAYLAGWRPTGLVTRFKQFDDVSFFPFDVRQGAAPAAMFAKCGKVETVEEVAGALKIPVVFDPARQLISLVSLDSAEGELAAPPPADEEVERFEPQHIMWVPAARPFEDGLHRFELHGRKAFRLRRSGEWYKVDRAAGQMAALRGRPDVLRWHRASNTYDIPPVMTVHREVSLPPLAERAAVAASGLLPHRYQSHRIYRNITSRVARTLGEAVGLSVGAADDPFDKWKEGG